MAESNPSTALQSFNFQNNQLRTIISDGEVWFVAKDACEALGITWKGSGSTGSLANLDDDEKGVYPINTPGGRQEMSIVNEAGLYNLILSSRNLKTQPERAEKIKAFKRWVTHEVLPTIRQTGQYAPATALPPASDERGITARTITYTQQARIRAAVRERTSHTAHKQAATIYLYERLRLHFRLIQWADLRQADFAAALALIAAEDGSKLLPNARSGQPLQLAAANPPSQDPRKRYHYPRDRWVVAAYPAGVTPDPFDRNWLLHELWNLPLHQLLQELQADGHDVQGAIEEAGLLAYYAKMNSHTSRHEFINCIEGCELKRRMSGVVMPKG